MEPQTFTGYIICTTPRSGSTLLCDLLKSTGATGNPDSFFHRLESMRAWAAEWSLPNFDDMSEMGFGVAYLDAVAVAGKAGTTLFGMRLQQDYLGLLSRILGRSLPGLSSDARRLEQAFGKILYVHLTRVDKVAQAVSLVKAEQSGLWHMATDGTERERLSAPQEIRYDFVRLRREVTAFEGGDAAWIVWFAQQGIIPLRVEYDGLAADPGSVLRAICGRLGVEVPEEKSIKPGVARLSDEVSLEWISRYKADLAEVEPNAS